MRLLRGTPLLSVAAVAVSVFAIGSLAADSSTGSGSAGALPNLSTATQGAATTSGNTNTKGTATNTGNSASNTDTKNSASVTKATTSNAGVTTTAVITGGGSAADTSGSVPVISITGGTTATADGALTGLPTLSGAFKIVAPSVPPTANAPYMQQSNLPEGTVFIAVGAILGFMAMSVLLWRGLVAWSLHRSVKRAALHQNMSDTKALFSPPTAPFYKDYHDRDSTISLGLGPKGGRKGGRPVTGGGTHPSQGSLFFSPTAGAAAGGLNAVGNRGSNYLPAGYYAAGAASPGNAQSHIPVGGHGPNISLSNLRPESAGYGRARSIGPSPPDSPSLPASRGGHMASSSTINLTHGYGGDQRAPSAYLEDLFDGEGPPVPGHGHSRNASGNTGSTRF